VYGVFGYIKLAKVSHLILIEEASIVGQLLKGTVYRVEKLMFVPLHYNAKMTIDPEDLPFVDMIRTVEKEKAFYFSYDFDLTKNMQVTMQEIQMGKSSGSSQNAIMREIYPNSVDFLPQYAYNEKLLGEFQGIEYSPFKVPCIFGYVYLSSPQIKAGAKTDFYLISRKDCRRPGRRFITRGLDQEGNAANFAETEHIFAHYEKDQIMVSSFV
jgi:hypothetical protein